MKLMSIEEGCNVNLNSVLLQQKITSHTYLLSNQ
jgi:hypothetical protein